MASVNLTSTREQRYFCPDDTAATFICTTAGTDLVWMVDDTMLSYNAIARVGAIRSNQDSSITSAFISIRNSAGDGYAYRRSVLTIAAQPGATTRLRIRCHNGSEVEVMEEYFLPSTPGLFLFLSFPYGFITCVSFVL